MIPLDLKRAELRAYHRALRATHSIRVTVSVLTLSGDHLDRIENDVIDGQVNVDMTADVTRSANVTFLDPGHKLNFDSDSPAAGALYLDRMLRIVYGVKVEELERWVNMPVFVGPITSISRSGDLVEVECQGKETLAMGQIGKPVVCKKGLDKVEAIKRIMREGAGEDLFDFPDLKAKLPKKVTVKHFDDEQTPWSHARSIARSLDRQLYYDGRGRLRLRQLPENPHFTFETGDGGNVLSEPEVAFTVDDVKNAVRVRGGPKKGVETDQDDETENIPEKAPQIKVFITAPRSHPLSPWRLGRNGEPRYLLETIENDKLRTKEEARQRARTVLRARLRTEVEVNFDSLPAPHIEPGDMATLKTDDYALEFRIDQFSLPLAPAGVMSVGYIKDVRANRKRIRGRRPRRRRGGRDRRRDRNRRRRDR